MRIKIIGENNCARATRHLLRLAGFAVTEFLPAEAITQAPHFGYAITIDAAPVPSSGCTPDLTSMPDHSTHVLPADANREASAFAKTTADVSALADAEADASSSYLLQSSDSVSARARRALPLRSSEGMVGVPGGANILPAGALASEVENRRRGAGATAHIHFDSADGALEAAVLRHVAQLAAAPVILDRPGGVVHSDRELRIVIPRTGDAKADEAVAVAVEFGVLRGMLDLTAPRPTAKAEKSAVAPSASRSGGGKKWWRFGIFALAGALLPLAAIVQAIAPGSRVALNARKPSSGTDFSLCGLGPASRTSSSLVPARMPTKGTQAEVCATSWLLHSMAVRHVVTNGAYLRLMAGRITASEPIPARTPVPVALRARMAASAAVTAAPAQGEFAVGQQTKITDGTNTLVIDPCKGQTKLYVSINQTANTQLAAGSASQKIYVCSIHVVVASATNVALVEGTGSVCATSTAGVNGFGGASAATGWNFAANGGIVLGTGDAAVGAEGTSGDNLCLYNSGSGQVSGGISYVVQ